MATTLVAVFDDYDQAEAASRVLTDQDIADSSSIQLACDRSTDVGNAGTSGREQPESSGRRGFFAKLFGLDEVDDQPGHYAEAVRRGHAVLTVMLDDDEKVDDATRLLEDCGSIDVDERVSRWRAEGYTGHDSTSANLTPDEKAIERDKLKVVQEELNVGKRTVERGGVRVHRRVTETPVSQEVTLREQSASIERVPVDRPATESDFNAFDDAAIELRETAEEPVVTKTARVVEEVNVQLRTSERTETVTDSVRRTHVEIEPLDDGFERPREHEDVEQSGAYRGIERRVNTQSYAGPERRAAT